MERRVVKTVCNLCGLCGCGMEVVVEDGRVVEVRGDKEHPENRGALCPKGRALIDILYSPDRLKYPLKRVGERGEGKWERISWDQALGLIADNLQKVKDNYGPEAVAFHKGAGHDLCGGDVRAYLYRLANVFGTPNLSSPFYDCNGPRSLNMFLTTGGVPAPDVENSKCVLLWGINPADSALTRQIRIQNALKAGTKLIVIDPRTTHSAKRADIHLQPRPGSDGALALGMLKVIVDANIFDADFVAKWTVGFEDLKTLLAEYPLDKVERITWVPEEKIKKAAMIYAQTKPACVFLGNALDQQLNTSQVIRAIADMIAITGNLDTKGGNVIYSSMALAKNPIELHDHLSAEMNKKRLGNEFLLTRFEYTKIAHEPSVYKAILEEIPYPVKAMFIMAANPMLVSPNVRRVEAALKKLDFLAVADIFMTKTAQLADVVLPACTFLEETYYATYDAGAYSKPVLPGLLMLRPEVVPPLEESRPDWQIIVDLAKKLGYEEYFRWQNVEEAIDYELKLTGITSKDLRRHLEGIQVTVPSFLYQAFVKNGPRGRLLIWFLSRTRFKKYPNMYHKYEKAGFMTPSKKVEILSSSLGKMGYDALPVYHEPVESPLGNPKLAKAFPLVLTTGAKTSCYVHSQMRNIPLLNHKMPHNVIEIHPDTAKDFGVSEGDTVTLESPRGEIKCQINLLDGIHPHVVQLYHGFDEANANLLTDCDSCDPITGSTPLRSSLCRVSIAQSLKQPAMQYQDTGWRLCP